MCSRAEGMLPGGVQVGSGVSELREAFWASLASILCAAWPAAGTERAPTVKACDPVLRAISFQ